MKEKINKIFIIFLIFLLVLFNFVIYSFGFDVSYNGVDYQINLSDDLSQKNFYYIFLGTNSNNQALLYYVCCDYELLWNNQDSNFKVKGYNNNNSVTSNDVGLKNYSKSINIGDNTNIIFDLSNINNSNLRNDFSNTTIWGTYYKLDYLVYSTADVYNLDNELVFQAPAPTGVIIPALETATQVPMAIIQTMRILIPIGLIILSMALIILLTRFVFLRLL